MDSRAKIYSAFQEWAVSVYKRSVVFHLLQTLECIDHFLLETGRKKCGLLELPKEEMNRTLDGLNDNKVFKFRNSSAMPWLGKLSKAVNEFVASRHSAGELMASGTVIIYPDVEKGDTREKQVDVRSPENIPQINPPNAPLAPELLPLESETTKKSEPAEESPAEKAFRNVFEKCLIKMDDRIISKEAISQSFLSFLTKTSQKDKHNIGISLHTGSIIFDALAVVWAAIASLLANETNPDEIVRSLRPDDLVIYRGSRYRFKKITVIDSVEYAELVQDDKYNTRTKVHMSRWSHIIPYQGKSTRLDGRGVRGQGKQKKLFYTKVLDMEEQDIPSITDTSTVFVMSREKADRLVEGISITFEDETISLLDLITASYFTDGDEYHYGGNTGKNEPVLKFTTKVSTGRSLLLKRGGNHHTGLFVCDDDILQKSETELPELLHRQSLQYVFVLTNIGSEMGEVLVNHYEEAALFACTRDFLLSQSLTVQEKNEYTAEFMSRANAIVDHELGYRTVPSHIDWNTFCDFRRRMHFIKNADFQSEDKKEFMINAWSLFNMFQTLVFPLYQLENMIKLGQLTIESPVKRMDKLKKKVTSFPAVMQAAMTEVLQVLEDFYSYLYLHSDKHSGKAGILERLVRTYSTKRVCIVVPKAYYATVLYSSGIQKRMEFPENLTIVTANGFDKQKMYDVVIVVGEFKGKRFDAFRCMAATKVISLLYPVEENLWHMHKKQASGIEELYNKRSFLHVDVEDAVADMRLYGGASEEEVLELEQLDMEVASYIEQMQAQLPILPGNPTGSSATAREIEIAAIVSFDTGEKAFLTPFYEACVYDERKGEIKEKTIKDDDLNEGDYIVFTRNDNEMHDIVDDILKMLLNTGRLNEREHLDYAKAMAWKTRLRSYMQSQGLKPGDIASGMKQNGVDITPQTIRIWIDMDAHTVGPRKQEAIREIGRITGDDEMAQQPEITMESCRRIRQRRRKILDVIERAIKNKLSGKSSATNDLIEREIYARIDSQADVLKIESFVRTNKSVPSPYVNRPVSL